jgi:hypothetical protein
LPWENEVAWDNKTPTSVTTARLLNSPAIAVYEELKSLAADADAYLWRDDKIEEALLQRNDPLVTLGLAQYGASDKVAAVLYRRGSAATGDVNFNKALRLGVLGNSLVHRRMFSKHTFGVVPDEDVLAFINTEEGTDELQAIVINAGAKKFLDKLYNAEKPYDGIPEDKYLRAVFWSHRNPAINEDESSVDGPDMDAWGVQKGIKRLMQMLPVTEQGLQTAYWLLHAVDPRRAGSFDEDPTPIFKRWQSLQLSDDFKKYHEGDAPRLDFKDEFIVMLAAVYGWYSAKTPDNKTKIIYLGSADDPDLLLRCAWYSDERKLTPEQMQAGHDRDGDAFVVAAMYNDTIFWDAKKRAVLEGFISGRLIHRYKRRCEQIKKKHPEFGLAPVSEQGAALLEDEEAAQPTEDQKRLERVEILIAAATQQIRSVYKVLTWVLIVMIVAIVMIWHPHF